MQPQSDVFAFLQEALARMSAKSPRFFQVYQAIGKIAALLTGIPLAIQQFELATGLHIELPDFVNGTLMRVVFWAGVVMWFMAKQPVTDPHRPVDKNNDAIPKQEVMPFTVKKAETPVVPLNTNPSA